MNDNGIMIGRCCHCQKENIEVEWRNDPFLAEIYPESDNPEDWWCEECLQERRDDI